MKLYFDTEFTGLHKNTTLISIGLVAEDNRYFYAEMTDYNRTQVDEWIQENVISKLKFKTPQKGEVHHKTGVKNKISPMGISTSWGYSIEMQGNQTMVREELTRWLQQFDTVEWVGDCCHFDFVLLLDLLADHVFEIPSHVSPTCYDINQALMVYYDCDSQTAFNFSREQLCEYIGANIPTEDKHNALYDAYVIQAIYEFLHEEPNDY